MESLRYFSNSRIGRGKEVKRGNVAIVVFDRVCFGFHYPLRSHGLEMQEKPCVQSSVQQGYVLCPCVHVGASDRSFRVACRIDPDSMRKKAKKIWLGVVL